MKTQKPAYPSLRKYVHRLRSKTSRLSGMFMTSSKESSAYSDLPDEKSDATTSIKEFPLVATPPPESDAPEDTPLPTQRALLVNSSQQYEIAHSHPVPVLVHDGEIMIRNYATGLNPIDWKSVEYNFCLPEYPWITGREMAGVVEQVGSGVTGFKCGDRVWTSKSLRSSEILHQLLNVL